MGFVQVDEVSHDAGNPADVYAEGWQTWSRPRMLRLRFSGDRLGELDARGLELTKRALSIRA